MTTRITNIAMVGVGGQGILLASEVISHAAMLAGLDVKKSEVHGMAQRGGSVVSQVRIGEKVYSPLIADGDTDLLMSFEKMEALRYANWLKQGGTAFVSSQVISPITVATGLHPAVDDLDAELRRVFPKLVLIDAADIAERLGNIRAANIVLTGALSTLSDIPEDAWLQAIRTLVKPAYIDLNIEALRVGRSLAAPARA